MRCLKMSFRNFSCAFSASIVLALPCAAYSEGKSFWDGFKEGGPYVGVAGTLSLFEDIDGHAPALGASATENFKPGVFGGVVAGWGFSNVFAVDVLGLYSYSEADYLSDLPVDSDQWGSQKSYGFMIEGYKAFDLTQYDVDWVKPYVGVGVGALWTSIGALIRFEDGSTNEFGGDIGPTLAWEIIVGAAFPVKSVQGMSIIADYRFIGLHDPDDFEHTYKPAGGGREISGKVTPQDNILGSLFLVGVSYAF